MRLFTRTPRKLKKKLKKSMFMFPKHFNIKDLPKEDIRNFKVVTFE
jgi:hypothetical protein